MRKGTVYVLTGLVFAGCLLIIGLVTGFITVRGWGDWTIGTNNSYCGVYWPHHDFYCETAQ